MKDLALRKVPAEHKSTELPCQAKSTGLMLYQKILAEYPFGRPRLLQGLGEFLLFLAVCQLLLTNFGTAWCRYLKQIEDLEYEESEFVQLYRRIVCREESHLFVFHQACRHFRLIGVLQLTPIDR